MKLKTLTFSHFLFIPFFILTAFSPQALFSSAIMENDMVAVDTADIEVTFSMNPITIDPISGILPEIGRGTYTIEVTNKGPHPATNLDISTNYHDEVIPLNTTVTTGTFSSHTWQIPFLDVGETVYLNETSKIYLPYGDKWVQAFLSHSDQFDPDSGPGGGDEEDDAENLDLDFPRADLALNLTVDDPNYEEYESVKYELTVSNDGPSFAPGVTVSFPFPAGMVYTSSNTNKGSYSIFDNIWTVGTLVAGETATLQLDLFTLDELGDKLAFAQIMTHERVDPDAYPGNDTDQVADEDDEASVLIFAPTGPLPDLLVSISSQPDDAPSGTTFTTFFDLKNEGTVAAEASVVKAYLSEDLVVSEDDLLVGSQSMFTAIDAGAINAEIPIEISIPTGTLNGFYKLILFADADEEIPEQKEFNNFSPLSFFVFGGPSGTCESASNFPWHEWISRVQINDIDNPSGKSTFSDFSDLSTDLQEGQTYEVELETSFSYTGYDEYWRVWIDFNGNGSLFDAGDLVVDEVLVAPADGTPSASVSASFSIPTGLDPGTRKMRVSMRRGTAPHPCGNNFFGEVEDYTANILSGGLSDITMDCTPDLIITLPDGENSLQVNWDEPIVNSTCPGGAFELAQSGGQVNGSYFSAGVYFIEYEATDDCGNSATCAFVLTVAEASTYCTPESDFPWHDWISSVSVGDFTKLSNKSYYSDFTNFIIEMESGESYNLELTSGFSWHTYDEYWSLWIDYDQNGVFDPMTELFYEGVLPAPANGTDEETLFASATVPEDAPTGMTRMRVAMKRGAFADPCEKIPFGEMEDYLVNISPAQQNRYSALNLSSIILYPNPASDEVSLRINDLEEEQVSLTIQDAIGRVKSVNSYNLTSNEKINIPLAHFENGIYFITVKRPKAKPVTKRMIVENKK